MQHTTLPLCPIWYPRERTGLSLSDVAKCTLGQTGQRAAYPKPGLCQTSECLYIPTPPSALFPWKGQYTLSFPYSLFPPFIAAASAIFLTARPPTHGTFPEKKESKTDRDSVVRGGAVNKKVGNGAIKDAIFFQLLFCGFLAWYCMLWPASRVQVLTQKK